MNTTTAKHGAYTGAGAGLVLFAVFGLMPGSLIGGAVGISMAGMLFGLPLEPGIVSRAIVLCSMFLGVLLSGMAVVMAASSVGWLIGAAISSARGQGTLASAGRR